MMLIADILGLTFWAVASVIGLAYGLDGLLHCTDTDD